MPYRFTDTDKWGDSWFLSLTPDEKLLFNYLCDNCDCGGFIEINFNKWATEIKTNVSQIKGACKGLERGLITSKDGDCFYIRNFLKHQKNLPLNENNKAHKGIYKRFDKYAYKFEIQDVINFIEGASKGLRSPTGIGIGNVGDVYIEDSNIIPKIEIYSFDDFWNDYDKKVGDRKKIEKKFNTVSDSDKIIIKDHIPKYKESQPEKQFRKNPETYLNNKSWKDEIIYSNGNSNLQPTTDNGYSTFRKNTAGANAEDKKRSVDRLADYAEAILQNS